MSISFSSIGQTNLSVRLLRLLLSAAASLATNLASLHVAPSGALAAIDWTTATHVLLAHLFGIAGLVGSLGAEIAVALSRGIGLWPMASLGPLAEALPAVAVILVFSHGRRLARWLPDLRSYLALALVAIVGGAVSGWLATRVTFGLWHPQAGWIWSAGIATGILLIVPPVAAFAGRIRHPWAVRLLADHAAIAGPDAERSAVSSLPSPREIVAGALALAAVTAVALFAVRALPQAEPWVNLLFVFPILRGTAVAGLQGGLYGGSLVGLVFVFARTLLVPGGQAGQSHQEAMALFPALLMFCLLGAVVGALRDRELALNRSLERANRLLREDLERSVRALTAAIEAKDAYTEGHVGRVQRYAEAVGRCLALPEAEQQALRWASILHDVGKIGVPEQVLNKPGALNGEERAAIERHAELGARILANVSGMERVADLVLHHQERFDGRRDGQFPGYPHGLAGEEIPLGARIIAVVDAFDAMTTDRPYRRKRPFSDAVAELRREAGRQFDPRVIEAFLSGLDEQSWA